MQIDWDRIIRIEDKNECMRIHFFSQYQDVPIQAELVRACETNWKHVMYAIEIARPISALKNTTEPVDGCEKLCMQCEIRPMFNLDIVRRGFYLLTFISSEEEQKLESCSKICEKRRQCGTGNTSSGTTSTSVQCFQLAPIKI